METQIWVSIPWLLRLFPFQGDDISSVGHLRRAIWRDAISPLGASLGRELLIFDCSLCPLLVPVPIEPRNTLHNRAVHSSRVNGLAVARDTDSVPPGWSEPGDLHVYLSVDLGSKVQIAEQLYETLWGKDLNVILEEISDDDGTWKYVPNTRIVDLKMKELGYKEPRGLLVRPEYDVALDMLQHDYETARDCGGVVVTGQPGTGKTCFLYYLLFRKLSEKKPVALEQRDYFILFHEGGVYSYPLDADPKYVPDGTWALSDSNKEAAVAQPCSAFQTVSDLRTAWLIQTISPVETRWRNWRKNCKADMFVMNPVSIEDITALSTIFNLNVSNVQRLYRKWGPSARTCLHLLEVGEAEHEHLVANAARNFVENPPAVATVDESKVSHHIFLVQPDDQDRTGRRIQIADLATDYIKEIVSYAAADTSAQEQIHFFQKISTHPTFRAPAGTMFEGFFLSWLFARPNVNTLRCFGTGQTFLDIPACGKARTTFFEGKTAVRTVNGDKPPYCLLPKAKNFPTADAIVITNEFIITIQVTVSDKHGASKEGFKEIKGVIPASLKKNGRKNKPWRHVFITHSNERAESLRDQNLTGLPDGALVYSGVFDAKRFRITREHVEAFNEKRSQPLVENNMELTV